MKKIALLLISTILLSALSAQSDYSYDRYPITWKADSVTFIVHHLRTQSKDEDVIKNPKQFAMDIVYKYIRVKKDSWYATFPSTYQPYAIKSISSDTRDELSKRMIQIISEDGEDRSLFTNGLLGKVEPLTPVNRKVTMHLWL